MYVLYLCFPEWVSICSFLIYWNEINNVLFKLVVGGVALLMSFFVYPNQNIGSTIFCQNQDAFRTPCVLSLDLFLLSIKSNCTSVEQDWTKPMKTEKK